MAYPFKNLVFEGGGVKGIAFGGAINALDQNGILGGIKRVGGTSAGAITAILVGLKYSSADISQILSKMKFKKFMDDSWGVFRDADRLVDEYGWYKGDYFREWMGELVAKKTGSAHTTFGQLQKMKKAEGFCDIYLIGTNLSTHFYNIFSHEKTPDMRIVDAARISMSIPLFFKAVRHGQGKRRDLFVDGGVLNNYPVKLFDRKKYLVSKNAGKTFDYHKPANKEFLAKHPGASPHIYNKETLGFRLDSAKEIGVFRDQKEPERHKINDFFDYATHLVTTIISAQDNYHLHEDDWHRTVYIDSLDVNATDFELKPIKVKALIKSGKKGVTEYLIKYNNTNIEFINRI